MEFNGDPQIHLLLNRIAELTTEVKRLNGDWEIAVLRGKDLVRQVIATEAERDAALAALQRVRLAVDGFVPIVTGHGQVDQTTAIQVLKDADAVRQALGGGDK